MPVTPSTRRRATPDLRPAALAAAAATACALAAPITAHADLSFNASAVSDYRYRGISQSRLRPALQGGADWSDASGVYLGLWASSIRWISDAGGDADVETDFYGGYKGALTKDVGFDVGVLRYQYFRNRLDPSANTTEVYGALTYGPATLKYSHSVTDLFGFAGSKNSGYVDLSAAFDVGHGLTLTPHVGYQRVARHRSASYTDYSLTLSKEVWKGITVMGSLVGTDADGYFSPGGKDLGRFGGVVGIKATF